MLTNVKILTDFNETARKRFGPVQLIEPRIPFTKSADYLGIVGTFVPILAITGGKIDTLSSYD